MLTLSDGVPARVRWELATRTIPPAHLARTFAAQLGAFYSRGEFDALARQARDLYATRAPERGDTFRAHLDRRLRDHHHCPVLWDLSSALPT
jgi:hypothetical protein